MPFRAKFDSLLKPGRSRGATPTPSPVTGAQSITLQSPTPLVPARDEALQKVIQECISKLSDEDRTAFQSAPDIMERLKEIQHENKAGISSSLTTRVERVLQCIKHFMGSLAIFIQQNPDISSLVVGGLNCILTVGTAVLTRYVFARRLIYYY